MSWLINFITTQIYPVLMIPGAETVITILLLIIVTLGVSLFFVGRALIQKDKSLQELNEKFQNSLKDAHNKQIETMNVINQTMMSQNLVTGELKSMIVCILAGRGRRNEQFISSKVEGDSNDNF